MDRYKNKVNKHSLAFLNTYFYSKNVLAEIVEEGVCTVFLHQSINLSRLGVFMKFEKIETTRGLIWHKIVHGG